MEHRKFGKLLHQLRELTVAQTEKVVASLQRGNEDAVRRIIKARQAVAPKCPYCSPISAAMAKNMV